MRFTLPTKTDRERLDALLDAVLTVETRAEAQAFLRDLLTEEELVEFGKRFQAATMLAAEEPYTRIVAKTGLSSTTVARVQKWRVLGTGGYRLAMQRLGIGAPAHHHHRSPSRRAAGA